MDQSKLLVITTTILICWVIFIIAWERISPYRKGLPFFREGFWVDLVWYTLIQSYFLKILIFDYIIAPIEAGKFKSFATDTLRYYKENSAAYVDKCYIIQESALPA